MDCHFLLQGIFSTRDWTVKPASSALAGRFFTTEPAGKPHSRLLAFWFRVYHSFWYSLYLMTHAQSCLTLCDPMGCSPPVSSVHGIFHARVLLWFAISSFRDLSNPGIEPLPPLSTTFQEDSLPAEPLLHFTFILVKAKCEKRFVLKADFFYKKTNQPNKQNRMWNEVFSGYGRKIISEMCHWSMIQRDTGQ